MLIVQGFFNKIPVIGIYVLSGVKVTTNNLSYVEFLLSKMKWDGLCVWLWRLICVDSGCVLKECVGSLCAFFNLSRCFCTAPSECHVCCTYNGKCSALSALTELNTTDLDLFLPPGSPCNDFAGYCNFLHFCRQISDTSALLDIHNFLFSSRTYTAAYNWLKSNWYIAIAAFFGLCLVFAVIIKFCAYKTPQKVKASADLSQVSTSRQVTDVDVDR